MHLAAERLDAAIAGAGVDGYLVDDASSNPDQYYLSGFDAPDPFTTLYADGEVHLLVRGLERARAERESRAVSVVTPASFDYRDLLDRFGRPEAERRLRAAFLEAVDVNGVLVPARFPLDLADGLRSLGHPVRPDDDDVLGAMRAVKTPEELEHVRAVQRETEAAMATAEALLASATVDDDGMLVHEGTPLTSERVRAAIERRLLEADCTAAGTIVAGGADAADPHERGAGPLAAGEPIVLDVFPQHRGTKYHADMTRTVAVGTPDERVRAWHELVREAKGAAIEAIGPGVPAAAVHDAACEVIEAAGLETTRTVEDPSTGFLHGTGHGVGLAVHEAPSLNAVAEETLEPGNVVTVEPGLYDPAVGGVRVEDLVVVTEDGHEVLTDHHERLLI